MKKILIVVILTTLSVQAQEDKEAQAITEIIKQRDEKAAALEKEKKFKDSTAKHSNTNYNYLNSLNKIADEATALKIANDLTSLLPTPVRQLEVKDYMGMDEGHFTVVFGDPGFTDEIYKIIKDEVKDAMFRVNFVYSNVGENTDLNIKGVKRFKLVEITGKYLQLFPIWKQYMNYNANIEECQKKFSEFQDIKEKLSFIFNKEYSQSTRWSIMNKS